MIPPRDPAFWFVPGLRAVAKRLALLIPPIRLLYEQHKGLLARVTDLETNSRAEAARVAELEALQVASKSTIAELEAREVASRAEINALAGLARERVMADRERVTRGDPKRLEHFGFKVYSQSDEDGIITEIFRRIGTANRVFVELGAETGMENNSRLLLEQGWSGLWIEGVPDYGGAIRWQYRDELAEGRLKFIEQYVDRDNINDLIRSVEISGEIDFLSIDIDGNDYHVFEAIKVICPRVVCLKHNHCYPPPAHWVMPYNPAYRWHAGKTDFGASICALHRLARRKGYELVGCGLYSANGFYVRSDLIGPWYKRRFRRPRKPGQFFNDLNYEMVLKFPVGRDIWPKR